MGRQEIIDDLIKSGLVERCHWFQTRNEPNQYIREELLSCCWEWLLSYDEERLVDCATKGHLNALITQFFKRQYFSKNSPFYKVYRKHQANEVDLEEAENVLSEDIE